MKAKTITLLALTLAGSAAAFAFQTTASAGPVDGVVPPQACSITPGSAQAVAPDANLAYNDLSCGYVDDLDLLGNECQWWGNYEIYGEYTGTLNGTVDIWDLTQIYNIGVDPNPPPNYMLYSINYIANGGSSVTLEFIYRRYICGRENPGK